MATSELSAPIGSNRGIGSQVTAPPHRHRPGVDEVSCQLGITAFLGSSIVPNVDTLIYDIGASDKMKLAFRVALQNTTSPMQAVIKYKLN